MGAQAVLFLFQSSVGTRHRRHAENDKTTKLCYVGDQEDLPCRSGMRLIMFVIINTGVHRTETSASEEARNRAG